MRKVILIPALALAAGLFVSETARAQPRPPGPGSGFGPGPSFRPTMPPAPPLVRPAPGIGIGVRPAPGVGIGISIGAPIMSPPIPTYPIYRPPVIIVDPVCQHYRVVYRECSHDPWRVYQVYESHRYAHAVVDQLRDMGYQSRVLHD